MQSLDQTFPLFLIFSGLTTITHFTGMAVIDILPTLLLIAGLTSTSSSPDFTSTASIILLSYEIEPTVELFPEAFLSFLKLFFEVFSSPGEAKDFLRFFFVRDCDGEAGHVISPEIISTGTSDAASSFMASNSVDRDLFFSDLNFVFCNFFTLGLHSTSGLILQK